MILFSNNDYLYLFQISETELNDKVTAALKLDDTQSTVSIRATLAQEYVKASSDQTRVCEMLIHDQHLQVSIFIKISASHIFIDCQCYFCV